MHVIVEREERFDVFFFFAPNGRPSLARIGRPGLVAARIGRPILVANPGRGQDYVPQKPGLVDQSWPKTRIGHHFVGARIGRPGLVDQSWSPILVFGQDWAGQSWQVELACMN